MKNISLDAIDIINKKLSQADAISALMIASYDTDIKLNDELNASVLWAISDSLLM